MRPSPSPDVISVEELFFNTNITTGIAVAHGRGVLLCAAERCGIPLFEYYAGAGEDGRHRLRQGGEAAGHGYDQAAAEIGENTTAR